MIFKDSTWQQITEPDCVLCGRPVVGASVEFASKPCHPACVEEMHEDLDRIMLFDIARKYGLLKVLAWIKQFKLSITHKLQ